MDAKKSGLAVLALLALCSVAASGQGGVDLVRNGNPVSSIVIAQEPTLSAQFAAREIQYHIELITGANVPIVSEDQKHRGSAIYVGATNFATKAGLNPALFDLQEYAVEFVKGSIVLVGRDAPDYDQALYDHQSSGFKGPGFWQEQGSLHASYYFLEHCCGIKWLNQTEHGTVVPKKKTLSVRSISIRRKPSFIYRDALAANGDNFGKYDEYTNFWPEQTPKFNAWLGAAYADPQKRSAMSYLFLRRMRNGGQIQRCNHSMYGYYDRFWNDPATRRAEFFAQGYEGQPPQMCYTSPELIKQVAQDARDYYDRGDSHGIFWQPKSPNWFPVEPMDNGSFCKCENCQALLNKEAEHGSQFSTALHSDYFFNFVNEVSRELHKTHPNKNIITLAYGSHAAPPVKIKLDPSVAVHFCYASNRDATKSEAYNHEMDMLKKWCRDGSNRPMYMWLYDTFPLETARNANLHCWPGAFAHTLASQIKEFKKLGVLGFFHCGYGQDVEAYLTFKLMDDSSLNVNRLLDEYFKGIYGRAAGPMKTFYLEVEKSYEGKAPQYTPERMAELAKYVDQADKLATSEHEKRNLQLFKLSMWDYMQEGMNQRLARDKAPIPSQSVPQVAAANGDSSKVDWNKAADLIGPWYQNNSFQTANRKLAGKIVHDGQFLYLELIDMCDATKLTSTAIVFPADDWEVFIGSKQGLPYRQYAFNPDGVAVALSHGEVNFRTNVEILDNPLRVTSEKTSSTWISRLTWPLESVVAGGVRPGDKLYMNIIRVWKVLKDGETVGQNIDVWAPFTKVHDMSRAPELTLE